MVVGDRSGPRDARVNEKGCSSVGGGLSTFFVADQSCKYLLEDEDVDFLVVEELLEKRCLDLLRE